MSCRIRTIVAFLSIGIALVVRSTARIPVFDQLSSETLPWLAASIPSLHLIAVLAIIGTAVGVAFGSFKLSRLLNPFWLAGLSGAIYVPYVFEIAPFLSVFSGRLLDFVLVGCTLSILVGLMMGRHSPEKGKGLSANGVSVLAFILFFAVGSKMSKDVGLSGDEPHYVLITHSIIEDFDLRVKNNYIEEDYKHFYTGKIRPHLSSGTEYSIHGIGLPIILLPGYGLAGLTGVVMTLAALGAMLVRSLFTATVAIGAGYSSAILVCAAFVFTTPTLFLSLSVYPELPTAAIVTFVAARILQTQQSESAAVFGWSLLVGTLPFFHMKFIPLAFILWSALAIRLRHRRSLAFGCCLSLLLLTCFFFVTTGSVDPTVSYGRQRLFLSALPIGFLGLLFDQEFGLLPFAPFYLVSFAGIVELIRRNLFLGMFSLLVFASVLLPGAAHPLWTGGNSPPARFLFPALPLLILAAGCLWSWDRKRGVAPWLPNLLVVSWCITLFMFFLPGQPLYLNQKDGTGRLWEALSSSWDVTSYIPSIVLSDPRSITWSLIGLGLIIVVVVLQFHRWSKGLPCLTLMFLGFFWVQDLTGVQPHRGQEDRRVSEFMHYVADGRAENFIMLPSRVRMNLDEILARVKLRLMPQQSDGDPLYWWSRAYSIPAGRYRVSGIDSQGFSPCNERNCFRVETKGFETKVSLSRFRIRAQGFINGLPYLELEHPERLRPLAKRSLPIRNGLRLHGLDDNAYLDRRGFWVKKSARATFAVSTSGELRLTNGGKANTVTVKTVEEIVHFNLLPWEGVDFSVPAGEGALVFTIESQQGFVPSELERNNSDHRELGVHLSAPDF